MTLAALMQPDHAFLRLRAADKPRLLAELARRAGAVMGLPPGEIAAALAAREALGSTGVGAGIAVPHAQVAQLAGTSAFLARLDKPVEYQSIDGRPVDLVFLLLGPPAARAEHLAALAAATRRLRVPAIAEALRMAATAEDLYARFVAEPAG